jgi:hypothetical protein
MKFIIDLTKSKVKGTLFYTPNDYAFDFKPIQAVEITLVFDYLQLEFDSESMEAKQIWGFNPYLGWINKKLNSPKANEGSLILENGEPLLETPWVAKKIIDHNQWNTYYDKKSCWGCFGDYDTDTIDEAVEFANGIIAVVSNGLIKAFWLKPVFTESVDSLVTRTD